MLTCLRLIANRLNKCTAAELGGFGNYFGQCLDVVGCFKDPHIMNYKPCNVESENNSTA